MPEEGAPVAADDDRPGHIGVPALVGGDRIAVGQSQEVGHLLRIDEVFGVHLWRHET